jgi:hypothetical protein
MLAPRAALLALTIAGAALAGCGGGGDSDSADKKAITSVVTQALDGKTKGAECLLSTEHLVTAVWGGAAACNKQSKAGDAFTVDVQDTKIDGDSATADIVAKLKAQTINGSLELKKIGQDWRLDEFGNDFVRSLLKESLPAAYTDSLKQEGIKGGEDLLSGGEVQGCLDADLKALPDAKQRSIGYAVFGDRKDAPEAKQVQDLLIGCLAKGDKGREALRLAFEQGIREEGLPDSVTTCVIAKLRKTASSELVAREIVRRQKTGAAIGSELSGLAKEAVTSCRASNPS